MADLNEKSYKRRSHCSKASEIEKLSLIQSEDSSSTSTTSNTKKVSLRKEKNKSIIDLSESDLFKDLNLHVKINRVSFLFDDTLTLDTVDHLSSILYNSFDKSINDQCSEPTICQAFKEDRPSSSNETIKDNNSDGISLGTSIFLTKGLKIQLNNESSNLTQLSLTLNNKSEHTLVNTETQTEFSTLTSDNSNSENHDSLSKPLIVMKTNETQIKEVNKSPQYDYEYDTQQDMNKNWINVSQTFIRLIIFVNKFNKKRFNFN